MLRRRTHEEHENHERWLVSYADFITLLFAFFVVMYATSSVNEFRHKEISKALIALFEHPQASRPMELKPENSIIELPAPPLFPGKVQQKDEQAEAVQALQAIAEQIKTALGAEIAQGGAQIRGNELWLEIELNSALLFPSGSAEPLAGAKDVLDKVADVLVSYPNPIRVEGFADDRPIATARFPSNWELSAARAARVVRALMQQGIAPGRLAAVGYGEFQPLADNQSQHGRSRNRRVVLLISRHLDLRHAPASLDPGKHKLAGSMPRKGNGETGI